MPDIPCAALEVEEAALLVVLVAIDTCRMSGMENASPLAASQRFINFISSDCERLIFAPSDNRSLFSVCDAINAVISTAWAWCMIMPCMNSTSACDRGGRVALVEGGRVLVGVPGAPGCTITDLGESVCWAHMAEETSPREAKIMAEVIASNMAHGAADRWADCWAK